MSVSVLLPRRGKATVVGWALPTSLASCSLVPKGQLWCLISCPWIAKRTICLQYETPDHFPTGLSWGWQLQLQAWERLLVGLLGCQGWGRRAGPSELPAKPLGKPLLGKGHREEADKGLVVPRAEPQAGNPFVGLAALSDPFLPPPRGSFLEGGREGQERVWPSPGAALGTRWPELSLPSPWTDQEAACWATISPAATESKPGLPGFTDELAGTQEGK